MVAYSFHEQFADAITSGTKSQTVRVYRRRNPRIGEKLQLFTNLRRRTCRKLLVKDTICTLVDEIEIEISSAISAKIASIVINGIPLSKKEIDDFAHADGFKNGPLGWTAVHAMGSFFKRHHGFGTFHGVVIHWRLSEPLEAAE
ncbi:MAG: hypothetical protein [Bacteriophage sp.]|nr:MAG: hypothetical protein [Bacteriophage sp.]